jgi:predicted anti-sigma-YlaC factor YlaD
MGIRVILGLVLAVFLGLTAVAVMEHGYLGFFELAGANSATRLLMVDLVITLSLVLVWMWRDAEKSGSSGMSIAPYAIVTLFFGAAGPLLYLLRRKPQTT